MCITQKNKTMPNNTIEETNNLLDLFEHSTDTFANRPLFGTKNKQTKEYEWVTYADIRKRTDNLRAGLASVGIKKGSTVAIIANNRSEWAIAAFATYGLAARFVPMYENETMRTWKYITDDSEAELLFVSSLEIYEQVKHFTDELPNLKHIFCIDCNKDNSMAKLEEIGSKNPVASVSPEEADIAALIYTSGTTGDPKGVLLSHRNFRTNARGGYHYYPVLTKESRSLSILPWAHSYGQVAELYNWFQFGGSIGFMESVDTLAEDLQKVKPTFLLAVPRVYNKIYDGINAKMTETGGLAQKLFNMGVKAGEKRRQLLAANKSNPLVNMQFAIADKIVFSKLRNLFGGQLQGSLTASALMNPKVSAFFGDVGIPIYDCYGLSETSPAVSMNSPQANRPGSVGRPLEHVQVKIDKSMMPEGEKSLDGEILVKGPNIMQGYFKKEEATKAIMTEDGWLRTGDRGKLDQDGFIWITGRIKEQYKLENGKYVFPAALEEDIRMLPYIENAMVYGDGKPYNICLLVPDCEQIKRAAQQLQIKTEVKKLIHAPVVQDFIAGEIKSNLKEQYGGYEIPKKFFFLEDEFSIENGMLTPTLKLKRRIVIEKYKHLIEEAYQK